MHTISSLDKLGWPDFGIDLIANFPGRNKISGRSKDTGIYHIRCTILPGEDKIDAMVPRLKAFHEAFMNEFRDRN